MPSLPLRLSLLLMALCLGGCDNAPRFTKPEPGEARSGGATTVRKTDQNSFSMPSANLSPTRRLDFSVGNSFFRSPWVIAPSTTTARDGLGPLFNTNGCQNCHIKDGRGHPPAPGAKNSVSMLVRLSIPNDPAYATLIEQAGIVPEPVYGGQLQDMAVPGVAPEGKVRVDYEPVTVRFKDGTEVELRKPTLQITQLGYGPMHPDTRMSARIAPPMIAWGCSRPSPTKPFWPMPTNVRVLPGARTGCGMTRNKRQCWAVLAGKPGNRISINKMFTLFLVIWGSRPP